MYRENYIDALRNELLDLVKDHLTPVAQTYGYSEVPLETNIKWRPQVLVLGNYSSGKSTLINELLGTAVQATGQAPTDDSFTIITYDDTQPVTDGGVRVTEERDGKHLLNDPEYPFDLLKKHGQRFVSHFKLKKVNSPFLRNLSIIDTPGMLDSISERDRGYNYQEVIGDFAQIADLVLILFDPHKAGTVREAHTSLRETLPARTFEDRVLFVLNRIDECASLIDLLQVYGTLCWNLSQMTGRKDIPTILLTYSPKAARKNQQDPDDDNSFLRYLDNQREVLKQAILSAPRYRLDHLASFIEVHGERMLQMLEALISYRKQMRSYRFRMGFVGLMFSLVAGGATVLGLLVSGIGGALNPTLLALVGGGVAIGFFLIWLILVMRRLVNRRHKRHITEVDSLTSLKNQTRRDNWALIRERVIAFLEETKGRFPLYDTRVHHEKLQRVYAEGTREVRESLNEIDGLKEGQFDEAPETFLERAFEKTPGPELTWPNEGRY
jgi:GTPase SAR1 family protein